MGNHPCFRAQSLFYIHMVSHSNFSCFVNTYNVIYLHTQVLVRSITNSVIQIAQCILKQPHVYAILCIILTDWSKVLHAFSLRVFCVTGSLQRQFFQRSASRRFPIAPILHPSRMQTSKAVCCTAVSARIDLNSRCVRGMSPVPADADTCSDADEWKWQRRNVFITHRSLEKRRSWVQYISKMCH